MDRYARLMAPHDRCRQRPFMPVSSSRGCIYKCGFCAIRGHWGELQRFRSADNVLAEVSLLHDRYGIREIHFEDDNLTADKARALAIFRGIQEVAPGLTWAAPSGLAMRNLDGELLDAMAASGCYSVSLAIESGTQNVLRLMQKPVDLARVPGLVREIQGRGMLCKGFFILGYPGETKDTIRQTVEFARSLALDWSFFFVASPLPHTEMWEQAKSAGLLAEGDWNPLTALHEPVLRLPGVEPEWLAETREQATRDLCFINNPNITRSPAQAIADFEHVLGLYPDAGFSPTVRESLERARKGQHEG
jgi:magnesium-protoporphyrin IX monomethyl ester (oxidative) cyclase